MKKLNKAIKLLDSLSKELKTLPDKLPIKIYLCGPTVYDDVHIGNIAPVVIFDFLVRYLKITNKPHIYVHNITDIDDKIVNKALLLNIPEEVLARDYENKYLEILNTLNVIKPTIIPRVSEHIEEIQGVIKRLIDSGYAEADGEDIVFKVDKVEEYGELSKQKLNELKSCSDFCLWKRITVGKTWDSPWGIGRPGWHTECFAFIDKYLKGWVHIHGGGIDLKFPHHENENAHCRALHKKPLADIWVHIGHLTTQEGKISKSGNNKFLVKDLLKEYSPNLIRLLFLTNNHSIPSLITKDRFVELEKEWNSFQWTINKAISKIYLVTGSLLEEDKPEAHPDLLAILENNFWKT